MIGFVGSIVPGGAGETIGVVRYVLQHHNVTVATVWPWELKRFVSDQTTANKRMVQQYVSKQLRLNELVEPHHAADALAAAMYLANQNEPAMA